MNYYPYLNNIPYIAAPTAKTGLFKSLLGGINWSSILSGTQKTLGIVNQAIPLIKQAGPVLNNAKTMFKIMNEFKKTDIPSDTEIVNNIESDVNKSVNTTAKFKTVSNNGPVFFQ